MNFIKLTALSIVLAATSAAHGQSIIVGWGGNTVGGDANLNGFLSQSTVTGINVNPPSRAGRLVVPPGTDNISTDAVVGIPFSETTQLSPTSGYTGQRFFGGVNSMLITPSGTPLIDRAQISNHGPNDVLDFRYALNSTNHDSRLAVFFDKSDFLQGGNVNPVQLGASSTLSIAFKSNTSNQVNSDGELRWIVRESGQWWISAANSAGQPNIRSSDDGQPGIANNSSFTSSGALGELSYWAPYDPFNPDPLFGLNWETTYSSRFVVDAGTNPFILKSFTDITGLGFYIEGDQFSTNVFQFEVDQISFSALVVPEPVTYVLLGVTGLGFFAVRNLRRKKAVAPAKVAEKVELVPEVPACLLID